jgi:hypothetical protein
MDERILFILPSVLLVTVAFLYAPLRATMYIIAFQKIIDIFWFIRPNIGGFDLTVPRLLYTILPIVLLLVLLVEQQKKKLPRMPWLKNLIILYLVWFAFSVWRGPYSDTGTELFLKIFAGYVMFGAGWFYFDSEEKFDEFARLYVITAIVPFLGVMLQFFGLFQLSDIGIRQQTESAYAGEVAARYAGFYHDGGTSALFMDAVIPLCFYFYTKKNQSHKWFYLLVSVMAITTIALGFSRGAWVVLVAIIVSWLWIHRQYGWLAASAVAVSIWFVTGDFLARFFSDIVSLVETGKWGSVSGKSVRWDIASEAFQNKGLIDQLFGGGIGASGNDIAKVTGNLRDSGESDFVAFKTDLGYLGWLMYLTIPIVALLMSYKGLKQVQKWQNCEGLALKYKAWFAMAAGYLLTMHQSGSRWLAFTFPLYFTAGFILKPTAFWIIKRSLSQEPDKRVYINPPLQLRYT